MQAGFTNMLTIVFFGVVLQTVMVLALVGCKRGFKVVFNTEFVPFGPAPRLMSVFFILGMCIPSFGEGGHTFIREPQGVLKW